LVTSGLIIWRFFEKLFYIIYDIILRWFFLFWDEIYRRLHSHYIFYVFYIPAAVAYGSVSVWSYRIQRFTRVFKTLRKRRFLCKFSSCNSFNITRYNTRVYLYNIMYLCIVYTLKSDVLIYIWIYIYIYRRCSVYSLRNIINIVYSQQIEIYIYIYINIFYTYTSIHTLTHTYIRSNIYAWTVYLVNNYRTDLYTYA